MSIARNSRVFIDGTKKISFTDKRGDDFLMTGRLTGKPKEYPPYFEVVDNLMSEGLYNRQRYNEDPIQWSQDDFRDLHLWDCVDALAIQQHRCALFCGRICGSTNNVS
jgi:hypothetical protein